MVIMWARELKLVERWLGHHTFITTIYLDGLWCTCTIFSSHQTFVVLWVGSFIQLKMCLISCFSSSCILISLNHFNGIYRLQQKIGSSTFSMQVLLHLWLLAYKWIGDVFLAHNILTIQNIVIKLEPLKSSHHILEHEFQVYQKLSGGKGIPCVHWYSTEDGFNAMALDCLGQSLENLFAPLPP